MNPETAIHVDVFAALIPGGGIGRYTRQLVRALETTPGAPPHRFVVTRNLRGAARARWPRERVFELALSWRELAAANVLGSRFGWRFDTLYGDPAVVHSPVGYGPCFRRARLINHVHDLTALTHPEWHPRKTAWLSSATSPEACRNASRIITGSRHVKYEVVRHLGIDPDRIEVVPLPVDPDLVRQPPAQAREHVMRRFGLAGPIVLQVGTLEPRKNHVRVVAAYESLRRAGFPGPLVLVGSDGWHVRPILASLTSSPFARDIRRIRDASDADLSALYGAATMTVFPSLEEGFGYPLLESMAHGTPCVTSDHPALVELAGGAAPTVPASDPAAIGAAMIGLWRDPSSLERWTAAGLERSRAFGFEGWAGRMISIYAAELAASSALKNAIEPPTSQKNTNKY